MRASPIYQHLYSSLVNSDKQTKVWIHWCGCPKAFPPAYLIPTLFLEFKKSEQDVAPTSVTNTVYRLHSREFLNSNSLTQWNNSSSYPII